METCFSKIAHVLLDAGLIKLENPFGLALVGCSREEIKFLEAKYDLTLPLSYKDFLEHFGHKADYFFQEVLVHYDDLDFINSTFRRGLELNEIKLDQKSFVFTSRYDVEFGFFLINSDDNPIVYHESEGKIREIGTFISYMKNWIISNARRRLRDEVQIKSVERLILLA